MLYTGERAVPEHMRGDRNLQAHLARYVWAMYPYCQNKIVLDVASGAGYGSDLLSYAAAQVHGLDISPEAVDYATARYPHVHFRVGDATSLPYDPWSFDTVVSFETIEHIRKPHKLVQEAYRVLRTNGLFIVSAPENSGSPWHVREYTADELLAECQMAPWKYITYFGQEHEQEAIILTRRAQSWQNFHIYLCQK